MRYELELTINAPREKVLEHFLDSSRLAEWQPSLVSYTQVTGQGMADVGDASRQRHRMGKREVEMLATTTVASPPEHFAATFEADGVWNLVENRFTETAEGQTHWWLLSEFKCKGLMLRLMATLFPGMFRKQTRAFMQDFKDFVEQT